MGHSIVIFVTTKLLTYKTFIILPFLIISGLTCRSCMESNTEILEKVNLYLANEFDSKLDSVRFLTIIPEQGCGTCITAAENFYNEFSDRNDMMFVFCNIMSNKILKSKVKINSSNTIFDYDNNFLALMPQNKRIYPCVLVMEDGRAKAIIWQSTKEYAFMTVRNYFNP